MRRTQLACIMLALILAFSAFSDAAVRRAAEAMQTQIYDLRGCVLAGQPHRVSQKLKHIIAGFDSQSSLLQLLLNKSDLEKIAVILHSLPDCPHETDPYRFLSKLDRLQIRLEFLK